MRAPAAALLAGAAGTLVLLLAFSGCLADFTSYNIPSAGPVPLYLALDGGAGQLVFQNGTSSAASWDVAPGAATPVLASTILHNYGGPATLPAVGVDFTSAPLPVTLALNASRPMVFRMVWSSTPSAAADEVVANVALALDGKNVAGAQVYLQKTEGGRTSEADVPLMSEAPMFMKGSVLKLHLDFLGALADFKLSLQPPVQSALTLWTVPPVTGDLVYLNSYDGAVMAVGGNGTMDHGGMNMTESGSPTQGAGGAGDGAAPAAPAPGAAARVPLALAAALAPLLGLLLVGRQPPGRRPALAFTLLLAVVALSGCFGGHSKSTPTSGGAAVVQQVLDSGFKKYGNGGLDGAVYQDVGLPVQGAHVALLGTPKFADTDSKGRFAFQNLTPGKYDLRVDASGFDAVEQTLQVLKGKLTHVDIVLVRPGQQAGTGFAAHQHDAFGSQSTLELFNGQTPPPADDTLDPYRLPLPAHQACIYEYGMDYDSSASSGQTGPCGVEFFLDPQKLVFPGTASLEVTLSWDGSQNQLDAAGIGFVPANGFNALFMQQKPSGSTWTIPVSFAMADRGHQSFTLWSFFVYYAGTGSLYAPTAAPARLVQAPFSVKVVAHKGIVPYEPPHRDFWQANTTLGVLAPKTLALSDSTAPWPTDSLAWHPDQNALVPPGTGSLSLRLDWAPNGYVGSQGECADLDGKWTLLAHPANLPAKGFAASDLVPLKPVQTGNDGAPATCTGWATFEMPIQPGQTDAYYQTKSNWLFYLDDGAQPVAASVTSHPYYNLQWTLRATAHLSPQYKFSVN